jgi:hypothetical protein
MYLGTLGLALQKCYDLLNDLTNLKDCISNIQKAVQLAKDNHPVKVTYFESLGTGQLVHHKCFGVLSYLDDSV